MHFYLEYQQYLRQNKRNKQMITDYTKEELAEKIAYQQTEGAELEDIVEFYKIESYYKLIEFDKEELYQVYCDMGLEDD